MASTSSCDGGLGDGSGDEFSIETSIKGCGAELVRLRGADRIAMIAPGSADIGDNGGDFVVRKGLREWRHSIGHRIARRPRRGAPLYLHSDPNEGPAPPE